MNLPGTVRSFPVRCGVFRYGAKIFRYGAVCSSHFAEHSDEPKANHVSAVASTWFGLISIARRELHTAPYRKICQGIGKVP